MIRMNRAFAGVFLLLVAVLLSGCPFIAAEQQQELIDATCVISGQVTTARKEPRPIDVVLLRREEGQERPWRVADHFVLDQPGRWGFGTSPGRYGLVAFVDRSRDLVYNRGEPYDAVGADEPLT